MQDFRNIEAWQLARKLIVVIYKATERFPPEERFALTRQIRRSVNSVGANLSEAFGRKTRVDTARVLQHCVSEGNETLHHLMVAADLGYLSPEQFEMLAGQLEVVRTKVFNLLTSVRPRRRRARRRRA